MDILYALFVLLGFLAVVMLLEGLYLTWNAYRGPEARRVQQRLQALSAGDNESIAAPLIRKRLLAKEPALERLLLTLPRVHALDRFLLQSGLNLSVASFMGIALALAIAGGCAVALAGAPLWAAAGIAVLLAVMWSLWVQRARMKRMSRIDSQLPDALDLMARAMQAGHAFSSALRMVGTDGPQPIAHEFQITFDEINFGIPLQTAMGNLATRVASSDLRFFVVAVLIQRETGGNLSEVLSAISALVRDRQKLAGTVKVLSAEARLSAWILTIMPFVMALALFALNREFISRLWTDPMGVRMVVFALVLMGIGIWWMWRMVKIRI